MNMKDEIKNLTQAKSFKVINGRIQLYDEKGFELDGKRAWWNGSFDCNYNQLTTLEGSPRIVKGSFYCNNNQLTTLKGAPEIVNGSFFCNNNQLTTLEGSPRIVNGYFYCNNNQLTTLKGAPEIVDWSFFCNNNQLTTLEGSPRIVNGYFYCNNNQLTTLKGAPEIVNGYFDCRNNAKNLKAPEYTDNFKKALELGYILADGILTQFIEKTIQYDFAIYKTKHLVKDEIIYVASLRDRYFAHGKTLEEAVLDLSYKISDRNKNLYLSWNVHEKIEIFKMAIAYRVITGACSEGVRMFIQENNINEEISVRDVIELTKDQYGHNEFKQFFKDKL